MLSVQILHTEGHFWRRALEYLRAFGGPMTAMQLPDKLPMIVDYPRELLPAEVGGAAVTIAVNLHHDLLAELPAVLAEQGGQALIAPREDPTWIRPGLATQVAAACEGLGIESAFPEPFCSLVPATPIIEQFCAEYKVGRPEFEMTITDGVVTEVRYVRGALCGVTQWVVAQLVGVPAGDALLDKVKTLHHSRPCLASMAMLPGMDDTLMHKSLFLFEDGARQALQQAGAGPAPNRSR